MSDNLLEKLKAEFKNTPPKQRCDGKCSENIHCKDGLFCIKYYMRAVEMVNIIEYEKRMLE